MAESKATAPHFYLQVEVDMSRGVEARARLKAAARRGRRRCRPSTTWSSRPAAIALREHPRANGAYRDGRLELYSRINVGVAVAAQDALVVPTVFDADLKGLRQIATETRALAERVRDGTVTPPELSGGTFTVSNLGMFGIDSLRRGDQPAAGGNPRGRGDRRDGRSSGTARSRPPPDADDPGLRPPDPLRGRRRRFLDRIRNLLEEPLGLAL